MSEIEAPATTRERARVLRPTNDQVGQAVQRHFVPPKRLALPRELAIDRAGVRESDDPVLDLPEAGLNMSASNTVMY
jgi:hypothetical protein